MVSLDISPERKSQFRVRRSVHFQVWGSLSNAEKLDVYQNSTDQSMLVQATGPGSRLKD